MIMRPIRLGAQDVALSRLKQGFESPMGHRLPYAFTAQGSLLSSLEYAVSRILALLYKDVPRPQKPKSGKTPRKNSRNNEIKDKYTAGTSVPDLAKAFGISISRVYQVLGGKRK